MTSLETLIGDYLVVRRAAGYKLVRPAKLLGQFACWLAGQPSAAPLLFTAGQALEWATLPADGSPLWWEMRLGAVRSFALWLQARDIAVGVPSLKTLPKHDRRAVPFIYSDDDIAALMASCDNVFSPFRAATMRTLTGLLAVTGMRIGEVIGLDVADVDLGTGQVRVRQAKFGNHRLVFLKPSSCRAVAGYLHDPRRPASGDPALLVSLAGTRLLYCNVQEGFARMVRAAGLAPQPGARPRIHDHRHTFATRTMIQAYQPGSDLPPERALTLLSTWLGHLNPADTYWYLEASPDLLAMAAIRLEPDRTQAQP
jgi:integrase/recombinase XerD